MTEGLIVFYFMGLMFNAGFAFRDYMDDDELKWYHLIIFLSWLMWPFVFVKNLIDKKGGEE